MPTTTSVNVLDLLHERFGLEGFRSGQQAVIERLLDGRSAAAIFPTGGGKSLCYQLPALLLPGTTIVVSPLLALMKDQVEQLQLRGIDAVRLDSTMSAEEVRDGMKRIRGGHAKLLYVAPERFFNERFREAVSTLQVSLFAVDEAHCISQWGHNFRPDYLKLARLARQLKAERVLALTATATPTVLEDICREFDIARSDAIQTTFYRENLHLHFSLCKARDRDKRLVELLRARESGPTLVYVTLQRTAEEVAQRLCDEGFPARAYHAGMDDAVRSEVQETFMASVDGIVVATIAFGMGVDKSNIRAVIHYNPSKSIENYAQEIGRAGRDGMDAHCEMLLVPEDRVVLENFTYGDTPAPSSVRHFVEILASQPEEFHVSHYSLSYECDIRETVIRTMLTYLELDEIIEATAPRYDCYKFKPRTSSAEILKSFEGERRKFAASVLAMAVKKKIWFEIDVVPAAARLNEDRQRIVRMLEYFSEQGWLELQVSGLVHGYRRLAPIADRSALTERLTQGLVDREVGELTRLEELFQLAAGEQCQSAGLAEHFGQPLSEPCGHCSVCKGRGLGLIPEPEYPRVGDSAISIVRRLAKESPEHMSDLRQQARFLCGLTSPKLIRSRITQKPEFGCCASIPFDRVLEELNRK